MLQNNNGTSALTISVYWRFFNIPPTNTSRVVIKCLWFIVLIKGRWKAFRWQNIATMDSRKREESMNTRQRQTERQNERGSRVQSKIIVVAGDKENLAAVFRCHYPKSKSRALEFPHIFLILTLSNTLVSSYPLLSQERFSTCWQDLQGLKQRLVAGLA